MSTEQRFVISVMSIDRAGIIHDIADQILALKGNIIELSQTVVRGYFTVLVEAAFPAEVEAAAVLARIAKGGREPRELQVLVTPRAADVPAAKPAHRETYILTARGPDQPGALHRIASFLGGSDINFEDLYCYIDDGRFIVTAQLTLPPNLSFERLQTDLEMLGRQCDFEIVLQHENIFRAVNEVRMVS